MQFGWIMLEILLLAMLKDSRSAAAWPDLKHGPAYPRLRKSPICQVPLPSSAFSFEFELENPTVIRQIDK